MRSAAAGRTPSLASSLTRERRSEEDLRVLPDFLRRLEGTAVGSDAPASGSVRVFTAAASFSSSSAFTSFASFSAFISFSAFSLATSAALDSINASVGTMTTSIPPARSAAALADVRSSSGLASDTARSFGHHLLRSAIHVAAFSRGHARRCGPLSPNPSRRCRRCASVARRFPAPTPFATTPPSPARCRAASQRTVSLCPRRSAGQGEGAATGAPAAAVATRASALSTSASRDATIRANSAAPASSSSDAKRARSFSSRLDDASIFLDALPSRVRSRVDRRNGAKPSHRRAAAATRSATRRWRSETPALPLSLSSPGPSSGGVDRARAPSPLFFPLSSTSGFEPARAASAAGGFAGFPAATRRPSAHRSPLCVLQNITGRPSCACRSHANPAARAHNGWNDAKHLRIAHCVHAPS